MGIGKDNIHSNKQPYFFFFLGEPQPTNFIPGFSLFMLNRKEVDWSHKTVPQRAACFALPEKVSQNQMSNVYGGNIRFVLILIVIVYSDLVGVKDEVWGVLPI